MHKIQQKIQHKISQKIQRKIWRKILKPTIWILPFFICIFILGASPGYSGLASQSVAPAWDSAMGTAISKLSKELKEQQSEKSKLLKESDRLAEKILREKQKSGGGGNRKLDSLMRDSQRLVSELESTSKQIDETELQLRQKYALAISALVKRLEEQANDEKRSDDKGQSDNLGQLNNLGQSDNLDNNKGRSDNKGRSNDKDKDKEQSNDKERKTLLKQLLTYLKESEKLEKPIRLELPKVSLEVRDNDTSLEIRKKAEFLSDQATLLKAKIFQVEAQVAKLEKEKALRDKVKKFADDMSFFDDTVLVKERKIAHGETGIQDSSPTGGDSGNQAEPPLFAAPSSLTGGDTGNGQILPGSLEGTSTSFILGKEALDSSPSDLISSQKSIDKQIELLEVQKSQLANQVQQLLQKTQNFYKRADELGSAERP
jgi:hypothetical protein